MGAMEEIRHWGAEALGLVLRTDCVCCGRVIANAGLPICRSCALELDRPPERINPKTEVLPTFASGPYGGAHRALVLAAKDHVRAAAAQIMGRVWAASWEFLAAGGHLPSPQLSRCVLVPAPTRPTAIKQRGGDIVTVAAQHATREFPLATVLPVATISDAAPDSVGLGRRRQSLARYLRMDIGRVGVLKKYAEDGCAVIIVDDVMTTGATVSQLALALASRGISVTGALALCHA